MHLLDVSCGVRPAKFVVRSTQFAFLEDDAGEDLYPDNQDLPLVNLPGGIKASKRSKVK